MKSNGVAHIGFICLSYVIIIGALALLPGASWAVVLIGATAALLIGAAAFGACEFRTKAGAATLLVAWTLVTVGIVVNVHYYTAVLGGTTAHPVLNNFDSYRDWMWSDALLYGTAVEDGYPLSGMAILTAALTSVFGRDITVVLLFQLACYLLTIIFTGAITWQLTRRRDTATIAMILCTSMCYLMGQATMLIKDVPLAAALGCAALAMLKLRKSNSIGNYIMLIAALAALTLLRTNLLLMMAIGAALLALKPGERKLDWRYPSIAVVCVAIVIICNMIQPPQITIQDAIVTRYTDSYYDAESRAWANIRGDYVGMPIGRKIILLPLSVVVQFLTPFPWNWTRDIVFGPAHAMAHVAYPWYLAGALIIYWVATKMRQGGDFARIVAWGIVITVLTAFITSGRASRYCLPYLPLLLPAAAAVLAECRHEKSLKIWLTAFCVMLLPTLIICHHMQSTAL